MKYLLGFLVLLLVGLGLLFFIKRSGSSTAHLPQQTNTVHTALQPTSFANGQATIGVLPQSGTFKTGNTFTVSINISSTEVPFNAAQATVTSSNLQVLSVTPGNCKFAFVGNPTPQKLSFTGAILGGKSSSCTVYTATVKGVKVGTATITFSDIQIVAQGLDKPIRATSVNSNFMIN